MVRSIGSGAGRVMTLDIVEDERSEVEALARSEPALHFYRWLFPKVTFFAISDRGLNGIWRLVVPLGGNAPRVWQQRLVVV